MYSRISPLTARMGVIVVFTQYESPFFLRFFSTQHQTFFARIVFQRSSNTALSMSGCRTMLCGRQMSSSRS